MRNVRRVPLAIVMVSLSTALAIAVMELAGRFLFNESVRLILDPDHRMDPNLRPGPESPVDFTNVDGIRSLVEPEDVEDEDVNIIVLGDSFVFGYLQPHDEALPHILQSLARSHFPGRDINIFNFGWITSSPLLSLRLLQDVGHKYKPDTVLLLMDVSSDFHDDLKYQAWLDSPVREIVPFSYLAIRNATGVTAPKFSEWLFGWPFDRFFVVNQPIARSEPYLQFSMSVVDQIHDYAENELGSRFVLFALPRGFMFSTTESPNNWEAGRYTPLGDYVLEPFLFLEDRADSLEYPYRSLLPAFKDTEVFPTSFDDDPHWNDAGTELAARAVFDLCLPLRCFDAAE